MNAPASSSRPRRRARLWLALAAGVAAAASAGGQGMDGDVRTYPRAPRVPIFFPPIPPPLDRPVSRPVVPSLRSAAPPEMIFYVSEFFYPQLASRLDGGTLTEKQRKDLTAFLKAKLALQQELARELERLRGADAPTRQKDLEALARRQAPRLAELEKSAEQLRRELAETDHDWSDQRDWHLNDKQQRGFSPYEIAQVMRAYAYYQAGLLPAQRWLLIEIALELSAAVDDATKAATTQPYFFFSPEPVRLLLAEEMLPEVATKVAAYQSKKSALKKQLYDAIYKHDGSTLAYFRNTMKSLAEKQAAPLAELEVLAEEIRRHMVQQPAAARPPDRSKLPPALLVRIGALLRDRVEAQRDATLKAESILLRGRMIGMFGSYRFDEEGLKFVLRPGRNSRLPDSKLATEMTAEFVALAEEYGRRLTELFNEREAIRRSAGIALVTAKESEIDAEMNVAARVVQLGETEGAYADYRVAVFEPGLSIEQRRLIFDAAVQRLDLPLPRGELQPTRRTNTW